MSYKIQSLMFFALLSLCVSCSSPDESNYTPSPLARLAALAAIGDGCQKWVMLGIKNYDWMIDETFWGPTHLVEVRDGKVARAVKLHEYDFDKILPLYSLEPGYIGTIDELCTQGRQNLTEPSDGAVVFLDSKYGFPNYLFIDWEFNTYDEETDLHARIIAVDGQFESGQVANGPCTASTLDQIRGDWSYNVPEWQDEYNSFGPSSRLAIFGNMITATDSTWPMDLTATIEVDPDGKSLYCGIHWSLPETVRDVTMGGPWILTFSGQDVAISSLGNSFVYIEPVPSTTFSRISK